MTNPTPPEAGDAARVEVPAEENAQEWQQPTEAALHEVPVEDTPAELESTGDDVGDAEEAETDGRGIPAGGVVAGGATGAGVLGEALWQVGGVLGLAAGAVVAAGGTAAYVAYRVRGKGRRSASPLGRSHGRSSSRMLGGKSGKLLGGRGAKLGGKSGLGLGKRGRGTGLGGKLGRKGTGGKLLGGKGAKLGKGAGGKLLGGGRGRASRLGMTGGGKSGGRGLLGRGGKAGLGLGARGGKLLGGKGKAGFGRWGNGAGGGAGILGKGLGKAARKTGRGAAHLAGKTKPGQHAARGFKAAKAALMSSTPGKGRWKNAYRAARSRVATPKNRYSAWAASMAAAILTLTAMAHEKYKAYQAKKNPGTTTTTTTTTTTSGPAGTTTTQSTTTQTTTTSSGAPQAALTPFASARALGPGSTTTYTRTTHTRTTARSRTMDGGFPLATAAAEVTVAAASYEPGDMWTVATDLRQLPDVFASVALALRTYSQRLEDYALEAPVRQELQGLYAGLSQLAQHAQEVEPLFRAVHAEDLKRGENPRTGEAGWNV